MAKSNYENAYKQEQHEPVFRRRIDANKQAHHIQNNPYGASALNYGGEKRSYDQNKRWNQNHDTQDRFLGQLTRESTRVDILLKNDSVRSGRIESYDNWSILIEYEGQRSLLFKSGVMAITPCPSDQAMSYRSGQIISDYLSDNRS